MTLAFFTNKKPEPKKKIFSIVFVYKGNSYRVDDPIAFDYSSVSKVLKFKMPDKPEATYTVEEAYINYKEV